MQFIVKGKQENDVRKQLCLLFTHDFNESILLTGFDQIISQTLLFTDN